MKEKQECKVETDLLIHPGETLEEVLADRGISQKELADRAGFEEEYINEVIKGQKSISASFAEALESALGVDASFWNNLQANYDEECSRFKHDV